ncbi:MAG: ABC transporter substrate-binding protein [Raoultibacter sp.]
MMYTARRDFLKLAGVGIASLSFGGLLASCSSGSSSSAGSKSSEAGDQVIIAMNTGSEPAAGFDPLISWGAGEHVHEPLIQSTLITTNADMSFGLDLATSYDCSDDGMRWTFTLRDDVTFSDGEPVTADDAAFTIRGILNSEGSEIDLSMIKDAHAEDAHTLVIDMEKPYNALLYTLAVVGIVPEHAYSESYGRSPIGSGRYLLEQWDEGQQIILVANPDYYGEAPRMKKVIVVFMEEDAALAAVRSGEIDIAFTSSAFSNQEVEGFELLACETVDSRGISLPMGPTGSLRADGSVEYPAGNEVTRDEGLRKAMNYALDREAMVTNVLNGYGSPAYSVCDGMPWATEDMKVDTNREKAQQILDEAGWKKNSEGILEKEGQLAAFTLVYSAGDSTRQALATEFSNQMSELGISVKTEGLSWDDIYPRQFSDPILWGWGSNSPTELYELNYSSGWGNFSGYNSPTSDAYFDEALATPEIADSYDLWHKAQWDGKSGPAPQGEASWVWLVNVDHLYFKRKGLDVAEQKPHPHGHGWSLVNNVDRWSWDA